MIIEFLGRECGVPPPPALLRPLYSVRDALSELIVLLEPDGDPAVLDDEAFFTAEREVYAGLLEYLVSRTDARRRSF